MTTGRVHKSPVSPIDEAGALPRSKSTQNAGFAAEYSPPRLVVLAVIVIALAIAILASIAFGAREVTADQIVAAIAHTPTDDLGTLAVRERIPRTAIALLAGASLAVSGALMQSLTRNPIAEPGILGINQGSALAVVVGIAFLGATNLWHFMGLSLIGAFATALFVQAVGSAGPGGATPVKLALAGMATTAALSSMISAIMLPRAQGMDTFRAWQVGSVGRGSWDTFFAVAPYVGIAFLGALLLSRHLDSLALGDEMAVGLGVHVFRIRIVAAAMGVVLCALVTAVTGPIAFIGLMIPHTVRILFGPSHTWLLPLSALTGALLLTVADTVGRVVIAPSEVPVAVITAFLGAPVLIVVARNAQVGRP